MWEKKSKILEIFPYFLFFIFAVSFFYKEFFFDRTFFFEDLKDYFLPLRSILHKMFKDKNFYLWNPYIFSGIPYIADIQSAVFYPLNFFFYLFKPEKAIIYFNICHFFLVASFTYLFVKNLKLSLFASITAAIVFSYSGFFIVHVRHPVFLSSGIWLPLALYFVDKIFSNKKLKNSLFLSLTLSFSFLGGALQIFYFVFLVSFVYFIFRYTEYLINNKIYSIKNRSIFLLLPLVLILTFGCVAIQLFPSLELSKLSYRNALSSSYEFATSFSLGLPELIRFLIPNFYGNDFTGNEIVGSGNYWEMHCYTGILALILSIIAIIYKKEKNVIFFGILGLFSIIVAFGKLTFLHYLVYRFLPFYKIFRAPARFVYIYTFCISMLAAYGVSVIETSLVKKEKKIINNIFYFLIALFILTLIIFIIIKLFFKQFLPLYLPSNFLNKNLALFFINFALIILLFFLIKNFKISIRQLTSIIMFILIFDYFSLWFGYNRSIPINKAKIPEDIVTFLKKNSGYYRILADETISVTLSNWAMKEFYYSVRGYNPSNINYYWEYLITNERGIDISNDRAIIKNIDSHLIDLLGVKIVATTKELENTEKYRLIYKSNNINFYENLGCLPRAFIVQKFKIIKEKKERLKELLTFHPKEEVILEENISFTDNNICNSINSENIVEIINYNPNKIELSVKTNQYGFLVLSDVYYPGWQVYINGVKSKIYKANHALRAVFVPEGKWHIKFVFKPISFYVGLLVSIFTLSLIVLLIILV